MYSFSTSFECFVDNNTFVLMFKTGNRAAFTTMKGLDQVLATDTTTDFGAGLHIFPLTTSPLTAEATSLLKI